MGLDATPVEVEFGAKELEQMRVALGLLDRSPGERRGTETLWREFSDIEGGKREVPGKVKSRGTSALAVQKSRSAFGISEEELDAKAGAVTAHNVAATATQIGAEEQDVSGFGRGFGRGFGAAVDHKSDLEITSYRDMVENAAVEGAPPVRVRLRHATGLGRVGSNQLFARRAALVRALSARLCRACAYWHRSASG